MPRGTGSSRLLSSMSHPTGRRNRKCNSNGCRTRLCCSEGTVQILVRWICLNLPLNIYAAKDRFAAGPGDLQSKMAMLVVMQDRCIGFGADLTHEALCRFSEKATFMAAVAF